MVPIYRVTVAIALCNNEAVVSRCIESVLCQTYKNLEILVIDDGSNDNSVAIARKYEADGRLSILIKENGGLSSSRQLALNVCSGEYICFIDADDYIYPTYVEAMLAQITTEQSDVCICSTRFIDSNYNELPRETSAFTVADKTQMVVSNALLADPKHSLSGMLSLSDSWNKMYRTYFLREKGITFSLKKGYNGTDLLFNHKVVLHQPSYSFVSKVGYVHIIYTQSSVRRKNKDLQGGFNFIITELYKEMLRIGNVDLMQNKLSSLYFYLLRYSIQDAFDECSTWQEKYSTLKNSINSLR